MTPIRSWPSTVGIMLVLAAGCAKAPPSASTDLTMEEIEATRAEVTAFVREQVLADYSFKCDSAACARVAEGLRERYSYDYGGFVIVADTTITAHTFQQHLAGIPSACLPPGVKNTATLDTLIVQVLSRDVATAAWRFSETTTHADGKMERVKGAVYEAMKRTPSGWRRVGAMDSHIAVNPQE